MTDFEVRASQAGQIGKDRSPPHPAVARGYAERRVCGGIPAVHLATIEPLRSTLSRFSSRRQRLVRWLRSGRSIPQLGGKDLPPKGCPAGRAGRYSEDREEQG